CCNASTAKGCAAVRLSARYPVLVPTLCVGTRENWTDFGFRIWGFDYANAHFHPNSRRPLATRAAGRGVVRFAGRTGKPGRVEHRTPSRCGSLEYRPHHWTFRQRQDNHCPAFVAARTGDLCKTDLATG